MTKDEMPKVYMTDEQWAWMQQNDRERSADAFRTGEEQRAAFAELMRIMNASQSPSPESPTKREWFAAAALAGLDLNGCDPATMADWAFDIADAMMAVSK